MRRSKAIIDLNALRHNALVAKNRAPNSKLIGVIKGDAYGHGAVDCARALDDICDSYAVAYLDEAIELQDSHVSKNIIVLEGFFSANELADCIKCGITPMIHHPFQLDLIQAANQTIGPVMVKFDTGMHRLGFMPDQIDGTIDALKAHSGIGNITLATHFAAGDDPTDPMTSLQIQRLKDVAARQSLPVAMANSAAILDRDDSHGDWNRAGIMLYGSSPFTAPHASQNDLQTVMTVLAPVIALRTIPAGDSVGYGHNWTATRESTIATLAVGYADGYPRVVKDGTEVYLEGHYCPIVGNVSMDMITVDVTDIIEKAGEQAVSIRSFAEMWGPHISVDHLAAQAGTIAYELLTKVTKRMPRIYR